MRIRISSVVLAACLLGVGACARNETLPASVTQAYSEAFTRNDLAACMALFAEDAQMMPERGPQLSGRKEIAEFIKDQMVPTIRTEPSMSLVRADLAIEQGRFTVRDVRLRTTVESGKYLHVWRKIDGKWLMHRVMYNTDFGAEGNVSVGSVTEEAKP
jgi:uncharacterized protein (TIGR02246 family)